MADMNEWAKAKADALKPRLEAQRLQDEKFLEDQKQKRSQGSALWEQIATKTQEAVAAINGQLGHTLLSWGRDQSRNIVIRGSAGNNKVNTTATFQHDTCVIYFEARQFTGIIEGDGKLAFESGGTTYDADGMAQEIVGLAADKLK